MLEEIKEKISKQLKNISISNITYEDKTLSIEIDSNEIIDLDKCAEATKIINPILDKMDIIKEEYTLEVITKEKGENYGQ